MAALRNHLTTDWSGGVLVKSLFDVTKETTENKKRNYSSVHVFTNIKKLTDTKAKHYFACL